VPKSNKNQEVWSTAYGRAI